MTIQWLDSYQVGDAELDAQHRELFAAGNRFAVAKCRDSRLLFSIAMFRHAREHFEFEENLMRRVKYPAIADHFKEHTDLISILTNYSLHRPEKSRLVAEYFCSTTPSERPC